MWNHEIIHIFPNAYFTFAYIFNLNNFTCIFQKKIKPKYFSLKNIYFNFIVVYLWYCCLIGRQFWQVTFTEGNIETYSLVVCKTTSNLLRIREDTSTCHFSILSPLYCHLMLPYCVLYWIVYLKRNTTFMVVIKWSFQHTQIYFFSHPDSCTVYRKSDIVL